MTTCRKEQTMRRKSRTSLLCIIAFVLVLFGVSLPVQATTTNLTGFVTFVDDTNPNPFGITTASLVSGIASFNALLADPGGVLNYLNDPTMALDFQVGSFSFDSTSPADSFFDMAFGLSGDQLTNIALIVGTGTDGWGLDIVYDFPGSANVFSMTDTNFNFGVVTGEIGAVSGPGTAVPEPATLVLLGAGLLGLAAAKKRGKLDFQA
jgi:hypothetical protein